VDLATVLYRDFGIKGERPSVKDLVLVFREEFGYQQAGNVEFESLFTDDSDKLPSADWLEGV
jgi:hypothetical protein